jgi:hypothetical protein
VQREDDAAADERSDVLSGQTQRDALRERHAAQEGGADGEAEGEDLHRADLRDDDLSRDERPPQMTTAAKRRTCGSKAS